MSARPTPKPPFWSAPTATKPKRLRGTHAQLLDASEDGARVWPYERTLAYEVGALLLHGAFGLGVVVEAPRPGRVTVRFCDSDRLLVAGL